VTQSDTCQKISKKDQETQASELNMGPDQTSKELEERNQKFQMLKNQLEQLQLSKDHLETTLEEAEVLSHIHFTNFY
jgi:hypothetical protein